jgi:hypothetical protein
LLIVIYTINYIISEIVFIKFINISVFILFFKKKKKKKTKKVSTRNYIVS